jgi:hypothetical protein
MRWQEQVTLLTYEMQWTVRYFLYTTRKWNPTSATGSSSNNGGSSSGSGSVGSALNNNFTSGGIAYRKRKRAVWEDFMKKADSIFKNVNPDYESPL